MPRRDRRLLRFARRMRSEPTRAESILWYHLRARRMGFKFRRQEPIGPYIADFACIERRVIVETDGDSHDNRRVYDARRDQWFLDHGWFVLRFWDDYVIEQTDDALEQIYLALTNPSAVVDPLNREY